MAIALDLKKGVSHQNSTSIEFQVVDIASAIGWNSGVVKHQLKNLEWTTGNCNVYIQSLIAITYEVFLSTNMKINKILAKCYKTVII